MKLHDLLAHHGIAANPFAEEDAQSDPVFQGPLPRRAPIIPHWDKVYGDPAEPGHVDRLRRKGRGQNGHADADGRRSIDDAQCADRKTAGCSSSSTTTSIRSSTTSPTGSAAASSATRRKVLAEWKLWDHMDAILSLGVTSLVDRLLGVHAAERTGGEPDLPATRLRPLDRHQKRDLLLLAACYDNRSPRPFNRAGIGCGGSCGTITWQSWAIRLLGSLVTVGGRRRRCSTRKSGTG